MLEHTTIYAKTDKDSVKLKSDLDLLHTSREQLDSLESLILVSGQNPARLDFDINNITHNAMITFNQIIGDCELDEETEFNLAVAFVDMAIMLYHSERKSNGYGEFDYDIDIPSDDADCD